MIPFDDVEPSSASIGTLEKVHKRAQKNSTSNSAFIRIAEALSLDMMAHAVGGFAAMTEDEQISSLRNIESTLPAEFNVVLNLARDVYYENDETPDRPVNFAGEDEIFGKLALEE
jgi:hypothetical protein|tara:strand:- start:6570 stop:6914 length:345 start_codon:yes stop_codon:yes gene_type:complete